MNAVEIDAAVTDLMCEPFDGEEFPYAFLRAFGNKETTIKRLRSGSSNKSDIGGVLQTNNIHIAVAQPGEVSKVLAELKVSSATARAKARYVLSTDGEDFEAEDLDTGETVSCIYQQVPDHFGFFLSLAGITTVKQVRESSFDIRATSRLNRLYVELLKDNPTWGTAAQRHEMNHFMARLIFCFFAEDTDIFTGTRLFTATIETMSARDSSNTHEVISETFRAMNTKASDRAQANLPRWADVFPYVNGGLFSGSLDVPTFSKIARSFLLHIGNLDWTKINPDIFGSMIQAIADDNERGQLGMHYTSMPNILKVLNPLFLDDLRSKLDDAGDNVRILLNLRKRLARIRVFDPACGSGNFLVIAYKQLRSIEHTLNERRGEPGRASEIPLTNFRGIEIRSFSAEIARLALIIAEFQCNVLYLGQKQALVEFLPLNSQNWITTGNALQLDWQSVCPSIGSGVKMHAYDLLTIVPDRSEIDFDNEGGETYVCGNPPWVWSNDLTSDQKSDMRAVYEGRVKNYGTLDFVTCWFVRAADYLINSQAKAAFVSTNSISQGQTVPYLWPYLFSRGVEISFAHTTFKWSNNAMRNATVDAVVIGLSNKSGARKTLFTDGVARTCEYISPYLIPNINVIVEKERTSISALPEMFYGSKPIDGGNLILSNQEHLAFVESYPEHAKFVRRLYGSEELIHSIPRYCLFIDNCDLQFAMENDFIARRVEAVRALRLASSDAGANKAAKRSHQFREHRGQEKLAVYLPAVSSEERLFLTPIIVDQAAECTNRNFVMYDVPLWCVAILSSSLHRLWTLTICGRLRKDPNYSNTLGWNTYPVPTLTDKNMADLARSAEDILLTRESHFPATIGELYNPEKMPADLREAHDRNDELLERIYIGRRFRNDTERLEKLFDLYTKIKLIAADRPQRKTKVKA